MPSVGSDRYSTGKRQCSTYLYEYLEYPTRLISPVNLIWEPTANNPENGTESILMWIHPSAFGEAFAAIREAIKNIDLEDDVSIEDLGDEFLMFELTGPRSTALLQAVLDVFDESEKVSNSESIDRVTEKAHINNKAHETWKALKDLRSSTSLSPGVVLGLTVLDPRLRFPKKVPPRINEILETSEKVLRETLIQWPDDVASSDLWNKNFRKTLRSTKIPDGELNKRRRSLIVPGQKLTLTPEDSLVPLLLVQRDESDNMVSSRTRFHSLLSPEHKGGWNVIIPSGWGMDFWKSFIFAGAWVAGLRERHTNHFESGSSCFPYDFPSTKSFAAYSKLRKDELEKEYNKYPPSKRVNYKKTGIDSPFEPPFNMLLGFSPPEEFDDGKNDEVKEHDAKELKRSDYAEKSAEDRRSWLLRGNKNIQLLKIHGSPKDDATANEQSETELMSSLFTQMIKSFDNRDITLNHEEIENLRLKMDSSVALVNVRIILLAKGSPGYNTVVYKIGNKRDYETWAKKLTKKKKNDTGMSFIVGESNDVDFEEAEKELKELPPPSDIIGYITTGQFSFSQGHELGIGSCSLKGILEMINLEKSEKREMRNLVLIRKITSVVCQPAILDFIS